jgi:hypothetical protein
VVLGRFEHIFALAIRSQATLADRASKRLKISHFYRLIFSVLASVIFVGLSNAQKTNTLAFEDAALQILRARPLPIDSLEGFMTDRLRAEIGLSAGAQRRLAIESPTVDYIRLKKGCYLRKITSMLSYVDSSEVGYPLLYQDTIAQADLGRVRKSQDVALRGIDPRWPAKYLMPTLLIGTGIAVIISLFYLRS